MINISLMKEYFYVLSIFFSMGYKVYRLNKRYTQKLINEINRYLEPLGHQLNKEQKHRILLYTIQSSITTSWFSALRGEKPDKHETEHAVVLGAITPFFDDLADYHKLNANSILSTVIDAGPAGSCGILAAQYLFRKLMKFDNKSFKDIFYHLVEQQDDSLKQIDSHPLTTDELREITHKKGGASTLLYRTILRHPVKEGEKEAIYLLGYLLQMTNDMFDVSKDYQHGQQTLFTTGTNLTELITEYHENWEKMAVKFIKTAYPAGNTRRFLCEVSAVLSRGLVCADQLMLCTQKTNNTFDISHYSRHDLVCDMEKSANILQSVRYTVYLYKKLKSLIKLANQE